MPGTPEGGRKTAITNKERYGEDFFKNIGQKGGRVSCNGGFASDKVGKDGLTGRERAKLVGAIGGKKSRRGDGLNKNATKENRPRKQRKMNKMDEIDFYERKIGIIKLREEGISMYNVAKELGISHTMAYGIYHYWL